MIILVSIALCSLFNRTHYLHDIISCPTYIQMLLHQCSNRSLHNLYKVPARWLLSYYKTHFKAYQKLSTITLQFLMSDLIQSSKLQRITGFIVNAMCSSKAKSPMPTSSLPPKSQEFLLSIHLHCLSFWHFVDREAMQSYKRKSILNNPQ